MLKKKNLSLDRKGYFRFVLNSIRTIFNEKNKQLLDYYNYKKNLENGNGKK